MMEPFGKIQGVGLSNEIPFGNGGPGLHSPWTPSDTQKAGVGVAPTLPAPASWCAARLLPGAGGGVVPLVQFGAGWLLKGGAACAVCVAPGEGWPLPIWKRRRLPFGACPHVIEAKLHQSTHHSRYFTVFVWENTPMTRNYPMKTKPWEPTSKVQLNYCEAKACVVHGPTSKVQLL